MLPHSLRGMSACCPCNLKLTMGGQCDMFHDHTASDRFDRDYFNSEGRRLRALHAPAAVALQNEPHVNLTP